MCGIRVVGCRRIYALGGIMFFAALTSVHGAETERAKRVLMISTEGRFTPAIVMVEQGVREALRQEYPSPIEFYAEYLDASRFPGEKFHRLFREYLREKYVRHPPDLVILLYARNFEIAGQFPAQVFPNAPVIVAGLSEDTIRLKRLGRNVTGFSYKADFRGTMDFILR